MVLQLTSFFHHSLGLASFFLAEVKRRLQNQGVEYETVPEYKIESIVPAVEEHVQIRNAAETNFYVPQFGHLTT